MAGTRILHLADLHLGDRHEYLAARAEARRNEADGLLRRIVEFALRPDSLIGGVLIAGDLFDRHDPPAALVHAVLLDLRRLTDAGIHLLTVPGNHDEYSYPQSVYRRFGANWPGRLVTNPTPCKVDTWELGGRRVDLYAMAFVAGRSRGPYDLFDVTPGPERKIAVLHGSLDADWSDRSLPLLSANLQARGLDYLALGHIHKPMERRLGSGWVCYPGRVEGGGFNDPGGASLVCIDPAKPELRPERVEFPSRPIRAEQWDISSCGSQSELEARLQQLADPEMIARLELTGVPGFAMDVNRLRARFTTSFFHLEIRSEDLVPVEAPEELAGERTIRGMFAGIAAEKIAVAMTDSERALAEAAYRCGLAAFAAGAEAAYSSDGEPAS